MYQKRFLLDSEDAWEKRERQPSPLLHIHRYLPLPCATLTKQEPAGSNTLHQASLLLKLITGCRAAAADMARVTIIGRKMLEPSFRECD